MTSWFTLNLSVTATILQQHFTSLQFKRFPIKPDPSKSFKWRDSVDESPFRSAHVSLRPISRKQLLSTLKAINPLSRRWPLLPSRHAIWSCTVTYCLEYRYAIRYFVSVTNWDRSILFYILFVCDMTVNVQ